MDQLEGRVAFVTGGASGIGLGIAQALVEAGMKAVIADLRPDHIEAALAHFESLQRSADVTAIELDVTDRDAFARAADEAFERCGAVHVLVNNAGVGVQGSIVDATFDDWDWGLDVNLGGAVNGLCTFLPRLIAQGQGGHVVNTSSLAGLTPAPRNAAIYATAKAGLVAMSEAIREELAEHGIGVSVLCAGPFRTNIREAGKNRQARYRIHSGYLSEESKLAERVSSPAWADPLDAGRLVRDGILNDRLYLVTHGEYRGWAEGRFEEILAAYPEPKDRELAARMGRKRPPNAYG